MFVWWHFIVFLQAVNRLFVITCRTLGADFKRGLAVGSSENPFFFACGKNNKLHTHRRYFKITSSTSTRVCRLSGDVKTHAKPRGGDVTCKRKDMLDNQKPEKKQKWLIIGKGSTTTVN